MRSSSSSTSASLSFSPPLLRIRSQKVDMSSAFVNCPTFLFTISSKASLSAFWKRECPRKSFLTTPKYLSWSSMSDFTNFGSSFLSFSPPSNRALRRLRMSSPMSVMNSWTIAAMGTRPFSRRWNSRNIRCRSSVLSFWRRARYPDDSFSSNTVSTLSKISSSTTFRILFSVLEFR
eukprot:Pompholyxophrys_punicea_v1_NODE_6_length_8794_cov_7.233894.p6 type:complete len:176 gc:universal NODE_6_length_8794_cov_7.233894:1170-643(-)